MSHYQPGRQSHLQQNNNAANGPTQPAMHPGSHTPYTSQSDQVPALRRTPSYIAGDDSLYSPISSNDSTSGGQAFPPVAGTYNNFANSPQTNLGSRHSQFSVSSSQQSNPSRTSSHGSSATSTYQTQPYSSSIQMPGVQGNVTYNPQQYARPHSLSQPASMSYNPQAYTSVNTPAGGAAYQTYNPAAYQGNTATTYFVTNILRQPSTRFYTQQGPTYSMPSPPMQAPPPPPPRSIDHPYGPRSPQLSDSSSPGLAYGGFSYASQISPPLNRPPSNQQLTQAASPSYGSNSPYSLPSPHSPTAQPAYAPYATAGYFSQGPASASEPLLEEQPPAPPAHNRTSISGLSLRASQSSPTYRSSLPPSSPRRTDTLTRHPQSRPLPGPPELDTEAHESYGGPGNSYDDLMRQVDAAVRMSSQGMAHDTLQRRPSSNTAQTSPTEYRPTLHDGTPAHQTHFDENYVHTNGSVATGTGQYVNYDAYSDESDAEAAAGIAMMHMADEEERAEAERQRGRSRTISSLFPTYRSQTTTQDASNLHPEGSSDSDYAQYDLALYGGGYEGQMHYGDIPNTEADFRATAAISGESFAAEDEHMPPFRFTTPARVDTGGTGGLSEPNALGRRLSFDYGDEDVDPITGLPEGYSPSGSQSPEKGEPADLFYHPGLRPLPPAPVEPANADVLAHLIPAGTYHYNLPYDETDHYDDQYRPLPQPTSSNSSILTHSNQPQVPRSTSLSSHSSTPRTDTPIRSKTDADRAKYKQQQEFLRQQASAIKQTKTLGFNATPQPSAIALDLPTIPAGRRKKFNPAKLSSEQFRKCTRPWALSEILAWVKELSEDENDLKEQAVVDAIVALFTHKVPTMNTADAETLGLSVVKNMLNEGALIVDEEWVKFSDKPMSGVLFQITGSGCYSARLHTHDMETFGRCYSYHCMRTLKKINLRAQAMEPQRKAQDWVTFYNVPKEVWESHSRKEIDRQNNLHEIVTTEDVFIEQLNVLRVLYRDQLATMQPSIISPKRQEKFLRDVFGKVDAVKKVNEDYLLAQLKYRQKEQGPFIAGFSDIFREWIRKAKAVYIDYAATFPNANYMVRKEAERNALFRHFLNQARDNKLSNRLSWDTYLKAPITRIQRYTLLLSTVYKNMAKDSEEKTNLALAIEEIKVVAMECDNKVGEMTKKVDLADLSSKLQLRPGMSKEVELNLEHLGREIMFQGDLQRPGTRTRFNLVDTRAILFDHYLVLAKIVQVRDLAKTAKSEVYDVSKLPIPMDLLVLESTSDDPVVKSSVRGVSTVTAPTAAAAAARGGGGGGGGSGGGGPPGTQGHAGMPYHTASFVATTTLENSKDDKILYPFKVKHLGKTPTYTLFAPSIQNRQDWCQKITEAKTRHAASLFAQNAEPFRLRVLADAAFAYAESPGPKTTVIKGTPLDRAIREVEARYANLKIRPNPVCRALVNCATVFQQPSGQLITAIGTDFGVFMSRYDDPRGWQRMIAISRVTQISVFEDFNLLLLIADKSLIAYHLDVVCPPSGAPSQTSQHDSARRAPRKLSGNREVGYFAVGRMKDRLLVVYKKRDGISSTFKVMEPVLDKSTTTRSRFMPSRRGQTEFFRDYDEFYIPAESYNINLFHSSLAISTQRGIEVLTLDKKQPWSIPMLNTAAPEAQPYLTGIGNRIKDLRPLGMFRLSDAEFLLAYSECAVYVNKLGDISRGVVMEFVGRAHTACLHGKFLILLNDDFVEVRNAMNGRLRQVIPGRNVVCLDDGGNQGPAADSGNNKNGFQESNFAGGHGTNGHSSNDFARYGRTVKICMQHPEYERTQIVLELITNEGQNE